MSSLFRMFSKDKSKSVDISNYEAVNNNSSGQDSKNVNSSSTLTTDTTNNSCLSGSLKQQSQQTNGNNSNGNGNGNKKNSFIINGKRKLSIIGKQQSTPNTNPNPEHQTEKNNNNNNNNLLNMKSLSLDGSQQSSLDADVALPEEQCDIPTFLHTQNCDRKLIDETRRHLVERYKKLDPDSLYEHDYKRMLNDDWTVTRFLLRRRQDPKRAAKLMEECGRFRKQYKMSEIKLWEFPIEFHKAGGLFHYAPDRVGNETLYMRVKMYRRVPEISDVFKAFILCCIEECDVANGGRGTAVIFDLSHCGLQNVDLSFLSWLLSSFRNYCPKGVSYILVYNLPWILNATCKLAMSWMSASNRRCLRFVHGSEIENFIAKENLPDYLGGTCDINYKAIPEGSLPAEDVCDRIDITKEQAIKIRELFSEYLVDDDKLGGDRDEDSNSTIMTRASKYLASVVP